MAAINSSYVNQSSAESASKGLRVEGISEVWPGAVLFRFFKRADMRNDDCISSPWWFQASVVRKILVDARSGRSGSTSVVDQATESAGLSKSWEKSGANYLLAAKVTAPLSIIWGAPRPVGNDINTPVVSGLQSGSNVKRIEIIPDPRCVQFYIPGMWDSRIWVRAVKVITRSKFKHSPDLAQGDIEGFLRKVVM